MRHAGAVLSGEPNEHEHELAFHKTAAFASAGAATAANASIDLTGLHTFRGPQAGGSCVAYMFGAMVQDMAAAMGEPLPLVSESHLYAHGRLLAVPATPGVGIPDSGSQCRLVGEAARDVGIVAESVYADTVQNVTRVPPARIWQDGGIAKITTAHRILATSEDDLRTQLRAALRSASPDGGAQTSEPGGVIPVDDAFAAVPDKGIYAEQGALTWNGEPVDKRPNHAQAIIVYDEVLDAFGFADQWGDRRVRFVTTKLLFAIGLEFWVVGGFTRVGAAA